MTASKFAVFAERGMNFLLHRIGVAEDFATAYELAWSAINDTEAEDPVEFVRILDSRNGNHPFEWEVGEVLLDESAKYMENDEQE